MNGSILSFQPVKPMPIPSLFP